MSNTLLQAVPLSKYIAETIGYISKASRGSGECPCSIYKNAERMILKHAKNVKTNKFAVGDYASLHIPCIDQTCIYVFATLTFCCFEGHQ